MLRHSHEQGTVTADAEGVAEAAAATAGTGRGGPAQQARRILR